MYQKLQMVKVAWLKFPFPGHHTRVGKPRIAIAAESGILNSGMGFAPA
jgi:hypothetical protein